MNKQVLASLVDKFPKATVGVIGDVMLDCFVFGDVERISPEAPIPILLINRETDIPGGAANTAHNVVSLGGQTGLLGLIGQDLAGEKLAESLKRAGIDDRLILRVSDRKTTKKTRVIARAQQLLRLDYETNAGIDAQTSDLLYDKVRQEISNWDAIIISDYVKGAVTDQLARRLIELAKELRKPILVDSKSRGIGQFFGCTLITPNHHEAFLITGEQEVVRAGRAIQKQLNSDVLITRGAEGMTLFSGDTVQHLPTRAREIFDVAGAGDTVVATVALALASGASLIDSVILANHAAAISVSKLGTAVVRPDELKSDILRDE